METGSHGVEYVKAKAALALVAIAMPLACGALLRLAKMDDYALDATPQIHDGIVSQVVDTWRLGAYGIVDTGARVVIGINDIADGE